MCNVPIFRSCPKSGPTPDRSLRRVLLSSLPGACVTGIKIDGVSHEYSTVKGIKESVLDIMLNLKLLSIVDTFVCKMGLFDFLS